MTIYTLSHGSLKLDVSDQGGVIEGFWRDTTPLLRPGKKSGVATDASCFPLVPFANRVSGNRFVWQCYWITSVLMMFSAVVCAFC